MNPDDFSLLLVDLQEPILARSRTNPTATIRTAASVLVRAAAILGIPVVVSTVPIEGGEAIPEIPGTPLVRKGPGAFDDGPTLATLRAIGRSRVAIGAVLTEVAGHAAATGALREGFGATLPWTRAAASRHGPRPRSSPRSGTRGSRRSPSRAFSRVS